MKLLITRPVVITGVGGVRSFVPGLTLDVDVPTAEQILAQQAGIAFESAAQHDTPTAPRRKKAEDAET